MGAVFAALFGFLIYVFSVLHKDQWLMIANENSILEQATALLFALVGVGMVFIFIKTKLKMHFIFFALMFLASMREMDWHRAWTTDSILKLKFYVSDMTPVYEKIIGFIVIIFLLYALTQLIKRAVPWFRKLLHCDQTAWAIGFGLGFLILGKIIDSMARLLPFLAQFHKDHREFLMLVEESFELTGAIFFVAVVLLIFKSSQRLPQARQQSIHPDHHA